MCSTLVILTFNGRVSGYNGSESWKWMDGGNSDYIKEAWDITWAEGEPNNGGNDDDGSKQEVSGIFTWK